MVSLKTPGKENGFRPNLKRLRVDAVRDFPEGCGRVAPRVQPSECEEGYGDMNTLPSKNRPLASHRVDIDVVRDFPEGCKMVGSYLKDAGRKSLMVPFVKDKEGERHVVCNNFGTADVVDKAEIRVKKALAAYQETLTKMGGQCDANSDKLEGWKLYTEAAMYLKKKYKWVNTKKQIGHIPGVKVGDKFRYRTELAIVGLHSHFQCGIDYMTKNGNPIATSVVESGRYANKTKSHDVLIYTGQGGNPKVTKGKAEDQKAKRGNLALMNSKAARTPVRVIRSYKFAEESGYVYDGLYIVDDYWQKRGEFGKLVYEFLLRRNSDQPKSHILQQLVMPR